MPSRLPSFKDFRRRSLASFRTERSVESSSNDDPSSQGPTPSTGSITPPSLPDHSDPAISEQVPNGRPPLPSSQSNRYSVTSVGGDLPSPQPSPSRYSPRITNVGQRETVYQKVLLALGEIGESGSHRVDGNVGIRRQDRAFPQTTWPVTGGRFKALLHLTPGPNAFILEFSGPSSGNFSHTAVTTVFMVDPTNMPPLHLAILTAKDSKYTYDAVPARAQKEGNNLSTAVRKFRMAAYLWQAFTAEQMNRNGLGRRAFRFEEEWTTGSSHFLDLCDETVMRSETRVHIVPTDKTVAEIRDTERAQQNASATKKGELFDIAGDAVRKYFDMAPGQQRYVAVLILDAHWDAKAKLITGHAALGGTAGNGLNLAIFGSHCLQSYPATLGEVMPSLGDCTPTDTEIVANDCNEAGSSWEAAVLGIGAHLHEVGHLLGLPHRDTGIMARDFVTLNRAFMVKEAYSTRTKSRGDFVKTEDEPAWHRLDLLRFRFHPLFRIIGEPPLPADGTVHGWTVENQKILVTANSGLLCAELYTDGDEICHWWIDYYKDGDTQRSVMYTEADLRSLLPDQKRQSRLKIIVRSMGGGELVLDDFSHCCQASLKLSNGRPAFRGTKLGFSQMEGSETCEVVFRSVVERKRIMTAVIVHHGNAVDGIEFCYDDNSRQLFGKRGGSPSRFAIDIRSAEVITGFTLRAGLWIDAIQILTSSMRRSPVFGNPHGGSLHTLHAPKGYRVCGVSGSCGAWLDGFSLLITR
ncbi:putative peptidase family-domain-containing protein [Xylariaceae sp. FL0255]|nr:putative peptidase family-domain-containing protein [Xylariaceae sp. FL0255]